MSDSGANRTRFLAVFQRIEFGPPKAEIQVRFLAAGPDTKPDTFPCVRLFCFPAPRSRSLRDPGDGPRRQKTWGQSRHKSCVIHSRSRLPDVVPFSDAAPKHVRSQRYGDCKSLSRKEKAVLSTDRVYPYLLLLSLNKKESREERRDRRSRVAVFNGHGVRRSARRALHAPRGLDHDAAHPSAWSRSRSARDARPG